MKFHIAFSNKLCKNKELYRVQKSVFLGTSSRSQIDELSLQSKEVMDEDEDSVYIFPMCEEDLKKIKLLDQAFDKKSVLEELQGKFF